MKKENSPPQSIHQAQPIRAYQSMMAFPLLIIAINILNNLFFTESMDISIRTYSHQSTYDSIVSHLKPHTTTLLFVLNSLAITSALLTNCRFLRPERHLLTLVNTITHSIAPATASTTTVPAPAASLAQALNQLAISAQEHVRLRTHLQHDLEQYRAMLAVLSARNDSIVQAVTSEMTKQYQSIISYAHYLDSQIECANLSMDARYDYDDVCESGFNLKLIVGALGKLRTDTPLEYQPIVIAELMETTLLALSSSLDRRSMKLTTIEVDEAVTITSNPKLINIVIWMVLLGTIRYAADESTLRMLCFYDQSHQYAIISIVASELTPGTMTPDERMAHAAYTPASTIANLFAETVRSHANVKLAELLLQKINASIETVPLSPYACEIRLTLPV